MNIHTNPTPGQAAAVMDGSALQNEAMQLERHGDLAGAERAFLEAIQVKEAGLGADAVSTALSCNSLGELYLKSGRLDQAEHYLNRALSVRIHAGPAADLAVTRDNLGRLYEAKGDLKAAREIREQGAPDNIACSNYNCPRMSNRLSDLSRCSACKSSFYCTRTCQAADWKRHKQYCNRIASADD
ncbi:hypothetical protein PYCCODRAFT_214052 [Trametes coccinea BRFM310]|uniref:MYND-type domain-containing protein n=1 Tax=Trametes coccinea (strain BRFM310) TaxID=1353009 RepID=A0A1Y2IT96_TRAC3|nr:hypothetical protein PYCCODRAFT_214052 [Trametes coccinea BRFM310]